MYFFLVLLDFTVKVLVKGRGQYVLAHSYQLRASDTGGLKKMLLKRYAVVWCIYRGVPVNWVEDFIKDMC